MRVIAGSARGTKLKMVPGSHVRPTTDRVKESLFNVLGPFFEGGRALDLFAGTGAIGIEALSRGIDYAIFVDRSLSSIKTVQENLKIANMEDLAETHASDARFALKKLRDRKIKFQYIFLDPPYYKGLLLTLLELISEYNLLSNKGIIVAEHSKDFQMPDEFNTLLLHRKLTYGNTFMSLLQLKREELL